MKRGNTKPIRNDEDADYKMEFQSNRVTKTTPKEELSPYEEIKDSNITFGDLEIISQSTKCLGMTFCPEANVLFITVMRSYPN